MPRQVTIPQIDVVEDITGLQVYQDGIHFMVGRCEEKNGVSEFIVPQQYETFAIKDELFAIFMASHPSGFVNDDLWEYVDILRLGADQLRPSPYAIWNGTDWDEPENILDLLKVDAINRIDKLAGEVRSKYITIGPGQELTYLAKLADANNYIAAGYPENASGYVWVTAESNATGLTPHEAADMIVSTAQQWAIVGAKIEEARRTAKLAVKAAIDAVTNAAAEQAFRDDVALLSKPSLTA